MHIGDKVRLIHDKQEGVVLRILPNQMAEIEIEDGFTIPVLLKELALVSPAEKQYNKTSAQESINSGTVAAPTPQIIASAGIFMAYLPQREHVYEGVLVNNTDFTLPFTIQELGGDKVSGGLAGILKPKSTQSIGSFNVGHIEKWPVFRLRFLYFHSGYGSDKKPLQVDFRPDRVRFFEANGKIPLIGHEGKIFQLDQIKDASVLAAFKPGKQSPEKPKPKPIPLSEVIDLHIEKLTDNPQSLSPAEMLSIQISRFQQAMERAVEIGMPEITFIHGVGAGVLRTEIHRRLAANKSIKYFEDAQKEKFGYGATKVKLS